MQIKDFAVEQWMNAWETKCTYNVAETCVYSVTLDELFALTGTDKQEFSMSYRSAASRMATSRANPPSSRESADSTRPSTSCTSSAAGTTTSTPRRSTRS